MIETHRGGVLLLLAAAALAAPASAHAQSRATDMNRDTAGPSVPHRTGRIPANGVNYYYEIHGQGEPLLLLHGELGSIDMFGPVLTNYSPELATTVLPFLNGDTGAPTWTGQTRPEN